MRSVRPTDADAIAQYANDREIFRNTLKLPHPYTIRDARNWISRKMREEKSRRPENVVFGIDIDGQIVGAIGLHKITAGHEAEIGYWLARPYWGRGLMTEAVKLVTAYGFRVHKLRRVFAYTFTWNIASGRVLTKAGFAFEGTLRKHAVKKGKYLDDHVYSRVR